MLNLTLSETIRALNNGQTLPNSHILAILEPLIDEKESLEKEARLADECKEALFSIIDSKITELVNSAVGYNENHTDSQGNYADLVGDDYVYHNRQCELITFCNDNEIDLTNIDIEVLENNLFNIMQTKVVHQFCGRPYYDKFVLAYFYFNEHEIQIDFDSIGDYVTLEIMEHMRDNRLFSKHCNSLSNGSGLFYQTSENVLEFYVTTDQIKAIIADMVA